MPPFVGPLAVDVELAEGSVAQHLPERREALLQDLLAMGDEQQAAASPISSRRRR